MDIQIEIRDSISYLLYMQGCVQGTMGDILDVVGDMEMVLGEPLRHAL